MGQTLVLLPGVCMPCCSSSSGCWAPSARHCSTAAASRARPTSPPSRPRTPCGTTSRACSTRVGSGSRRRVPRARPRGGAGRRTLQRRRSSWRRRGVSGRPQLRAHTRARVLREQLQVTTRPGRSSRDVRAGGARPPRRSSAARAARCRSMAEGGRLRRAARLPAGQADAARCGARVRPHVRGRRASDGVTLLITSGVPLRRRAGGAVRARTPTRSGSRRRAIRFTATGPSSTSGRRTPTAGFSAMRAVSTSSSATPGSRGTAGTALNPRSAPPVGRRANARVPSFVPALYRAADRPCREPLERVRGPARRPALRGVELQPVRRSAAPGARGIAQFMPGTARSLRPREPVRRRARRSMPRRT